MAFTPRLRLKRVAVVVCILIFRPMMYCIYKECRWVVVGKGSIFITMEYLAIEIVVINQVIPENYS